MNDDGWQPTPMDGESHPSGRWPANVVLDGAAAAMLDAQSGKREAGNHPAHRRGIGFIALAGHQNAGTDGERRSTDSGGASRFFLTVRPDSVVQYDSYCETTESDEWARPDLRQSTLQASGTPRPRDITDSTFGTLLPSEDAPSWPTSLNGSGITDPSRTATKSTTKTSTSRTTTSLTSNSLTTSPINDCTADAPEPTTGDGLSPAASAVNSSALTPIIGTSVSKVGRSTDVAAPATSERSLLINSGDAPRFFYTSKASRAERTIGGAAPIHPTVKPLDLMQWLVRLVTPPGGVVLDCFAGSGTTGVACDREGFDAILIEREAEYIPIIRARVRGDAPLFAAAEVQP
jgi:hypothetical protein